MSDTMEGEMIPVPLDAFTKIAELAIAKGVAPINSVRGCWEFTLAGEPEMRVAVNGHRVPCKDSSGTEIPPLHAYAEWNGWPFAMLSPFGGDFLQSPSRKPGSSERLLTMRLTRAIREARNTG